MIASRHISLSAHGALELAVGLAVAAAPFALGLGPAAMVVCVAVGAVLMGLALGAATLDDGTGSVAAHHAFDRGTVLGLIGGALVLGFLGEAAATLVLGAAAAAQLALSMTTRYAAR